jgi:polysaccharide export outer membrane protein
MTVFRSTFPLRSLLQSAALGLLLMVQPARAADDQDGGSFTTPGGSMRQPDSAPEGRARTEGTAITNTQRMQGRPGNAANAPGARDVDGVEPALRRREPPPKPSEFQKFVQAATGRLLPVFGSSFFAAPADSFTPVDNVPVSADYTVGPGDEIVVRAWGSIDIDYRSTVDRNGQLNLPKIGSFTVAGVKAADLEKQLRAQIGRLYTNFNLSVNLGRLHGVKVFVVGPAQRPGVFTLGSQATLLSAVVAAGGPGPNGSMRKVSLRRDGRVVSELDVYAFLVQGDKSKDLQLVAGDVVVFYPVGPRVALNGELDNAAIYELKGTQEPVSELLGYAGGAPVLANPNRAVLERIDPSQPRAARFVEEFKLDAAGQQKPLRDGDVVTLLTISPAFANAVTLKGHVAQPLRYAYFPGMRISDLIPSPEALISPDFYRRKNLLVQVFEEEVTTEETRERKSDTVNALGEKERTSNSAKGSAPGSTAARQRSRQPNENVEALTTVELAKKSPTALFDDLNWDYAVVERLNPKELNTEVIPFNLGKVVLQGDPANNIELKPGDVVTVFSQKDFRVPVARQNRLVALEGEVAVPGVYQLLPGETLRQLLTRAGGFTPQAYIFGTEFSREETRQRQRENLTAAIARLESQAATQAARQAANQRDEVNASRASEVSNAATQAQLARLARVQPNGRIALELAPDANSIESLPDFPLDNADRVVVPPRPGFVTVVGAVVNSNAFLWRPGRTAGDYLRIAGPDEAANLSTMFILRADGTVTSGTTDSRGFFGSSGVEAQAMHPGDALVVPNQLDFETWGRAFTRNAKDWTQILANFGLGIAALKTLGL